jgi:hypothetical protein
MKTLAIVLGILKTTKLVLPWNVNNYALVYTKTYLIFNNLFIPLTPFFSFWLPNFFTIKIWTAKSKKSFAA